jgi:hypothetical protein
MLILQGKIMRYAPSRFWLLPHLTSEHKRKIQRVETYALKNPSSWRRSGNQKEAKCDGKAAAGFPSACSS